MPTPPIELPHWPYNQFTPRHNWDACDNNDNRQKFVVRATDFEPQRTCFGPTLVIAATGAQAHRLNMYRFTIIHQFSNAASYSDGMDRAGWAIELLADLAHEFVGSRWFATPCLKFPASFLNVRDQPVASGLG